MSLTQFKPADMPTFSFEQDGQDGIYEFEIRDQIFARLQRTSCSVAALYFVKNNVRTSVPEDLIVCDQTHGTGVMKFPGQDAFPLCWTDSYLIKWNGNSVLLSTQRQWSVKSVVPLNY